MKIIWSRKAETQLNQIFEYIAADSTLYAHRTIDKTIGVTETTQNPQIARKVPEFDRKDIQEMLVHSYRIIYINSQRDKMLIFYQLHWFLPK